MVPVMIQSLYRYGTHVYGVLRGAAREFIEDGCFNTAAALTYTSLFAVVPFMTVTYAVFSILPAFEGVGDQIQAFVFDNFVPASGEAIQGHLRSFSEQARGLTALGIAILLVTAYMTLVTIERALNRIWRVPKPRAGTTRLLVYWTMMTFGPPAIAVTVLASSYVLSLPLVTDADVLHLRASLVTWLPWLTSGVAFFLLFWAIPNCRVPVRDALIGALVTTIAFQSMIAVFKLVVSNSSYQVVYGTFAAVPLFLTWLYLCWTLVLVGAVLVKQMGQPMALDSSTCPPLELALRILRRLHAAHRIGQPVSHVELLRMGTRVNRQRWDEVMTVLKSSGFLAELDDGMFVLGRDLRHVSLLQLYLLLPVDAHTATMSDLPMVERRLRALMEDAAACLNVSLEDVFDDASPFSDPIEADPQSSAAAAAVVDDSSAAGRADGVRAVGGAGS